MKTIEEQAKEAALRADATHNSALMPRTRVIYREGVRSGFLAAAAPREELIAELVGALRHARSTVAMVHREFNSDRFTDRYGDGERATARLAIIDAALAKAEARQ